MDKTFKITESLAVDLLGHKWVRGTSSEVDTDYRPNEPIRTDIRIIAHTSHSPSTKDEYLTLCSEVVGDTLFEGYDMKFDRVFYDTCIYLTYHEGRNKLDVIVGLPHGITDETKLALYSDIGGCEMVENQYDSVYKSYSCGVK